VITKLATYEGAQPHSFSFLFLYFSVLLHHERNGFSDQFNYLLRAGFRGLYHEIPSLCFCFRKRSKLGSSLFTFGSAVAVTSRECLSVSSSWLIWFLDQIKPEARLWNNSQSVNIAVSIIITYTPPYKITKYRTYSYITLYCHRSHQSSTRYIHAIHKPPRIHINCISNYDFHVKIFHLYIISSYFSVLY
jgi:hypothetical protein